LAARDGLVLRRPRQEKTQARNDLNIVMASLRSVDTAYASGNAAEALKNFVIGLPVLVAGTWVGLRLYARLDEAGFRKVVLGLLLVSGLGLVIRGS
jgi:uncharacterized membrane protein YfcA